MLGAIRKILMLFGLIAQEPDAGEKIQRLRKTSKQAMGWLVVTELLEIAQLYPIKWFIDGIALQKGPNYLFGVVALMLAVDVVVRVVANIMHRIRHMVDWQQYTLLLGYGHTKQLSMDVAWHTKHGTNEKESLIGKNLQRIEHLTDAVLYQGLPVAIRIILTLGVLVFISPLFALFGGVIVAGFVAVMAYNKRYIDPLNEAGHADWKDMHTRGTELSSKSRTLKQFGVEAEVAEQYRDRIEGHYQRDIARHGLWRRYQRRQEYVLMTAFTLMYGLFVMNYGTGESVGSVVLLSTWLQRIFVNLYQFRDVQRHVSEGGEALNEYLELFKTTPTVRQPSQARLPHMAAGKIELSGMSFAYADNCEPTLKDLNLTIEPNTTLALVGPSGGGKSTLVSLLTREADPTDGKVLFDGIDLRSFDYNVLRRQWVGLVAQDVQLLEGTIADNIRVGDSCADMNAVQIAAKAACADEFIELFQDGYETQVGENGVRLSGGQRQRVAIARALLRTPKVLILDEATSALDARSQHFVKETIDGMIRSRQSTIVVIAHRLSTTRSADTIAYMEDGRIVEQGSHDELMALGGRYAAMVAHEVGDHLD